MFFYLIIFLISSIFGWVLEVFYRSYKRNFELVNPGFLKGPYLPIYGFAGIILFLLSEILLDKNIFLNILVYFFILTLLEFITGIIFEKYFKLKLWDYKNKKLNYKGIICLEFSVYWTILALFFAKYFYLIFLKIENIYYSEILLLVLGFIYGIIFIDMFESFKLAYKIRSFISSLKIKIKSNIVELQFFLKDFEKDSRAKIIDNKSWKNFFSNLSIFFRMDEKNIKENLENFLNKYKEKIDDKKNYL
jgi:uncharacterized membrane protein